MRRSLIRVARKRAATRFPLRREYIFASGNLLLAESDVQAFPFFFFLTVFFISSRDAHTPESGNINTKVQSLLSTESRAMKQSGDQFRDRSPLDTSAMLIAHDRINIQTPLDHCTADGPPCCLRATDGQLISVHLLLPAAHR